MDKPFFRAAVAIRPERTLTWHAMMIEELTASGVGVTCWRETNAAAGEAASRTGAGLALAAGEATPGIGAVLTPAEGMSRNPDTGEGQDRAAGRRRACGADRAPSAYSEVGELYDREMREGIGKYVPAALCAGLCAFLGSVAGDTFFDPPAGSTGAGIGGGLGGFLGSLTLTMREYALKPAPRGFLGTLGPDIPPPWLALLPVERLLERPKPDLFATAKVIPPASDGEGPADILVLTPGSVVPACVLEKLAWGVLEIEPVHPDRFGPGHLEGRVLWRRHGQAPRLAFTTYTSVQGPAPHSWARPHFAKLAATPARIVSRIRREGEAFWESCPAATPQPPFTPGLKDLGAYAARFVRWGLKRAARDLLMRRQWFLAVRPGDGDPERPDFASEPFTPLYPPKGTGWADPFLVTHEGRDWLFLEEIPGRSKGVISVMERLPGGGFGPPRRVLAEPFHLSYPNVFAHKGHVYMVPESAQANQARLYRATDFPGGWTLDRVLVDGLPITDATFLFHGGKWWMFASARPRGGSSWDELHLFVSEDRLGPYRAHPANPVVSDVRRARPAGRIFEKNGRLYRPAQDCSGCYGRALAVMEITRLTETGYEEKQTARLEPDLIPGSFCLHTLEARQGLEIVDGQRFVPLWR